MNNKELMLIEGAHQKPKEGEKMSIVKKPSFGAYFLAFVFPPGYFFTRKRIGAGIFSLILLFVSLPLFIVFGLGIFIWVGNAFWAMWNLRYEVMNAYVQEQARAIAIELNAQKNQ